ncbi:MAG: reverse transcriptase family protein [Patescibacteria group bacterium]|nr:reverse transcriptase family protein [Patescibacteria group bacterium]
MNSLPDENRVSPFASNPWFDAFFIPKKFTCILFGAVLKSTYTKIYKEGAMLFDIILKNIDGTPGFNKFTYRDVNPVAKTVKMRTLYAPNNAMRQVHRGLIFYLRRHLLEHHPLPHATGAMRGSSPKKNVLRHRGNRFFYLTDIHNFYPSVDAERLAGILMNLDERLMEDETGLLAFLNKYCIADEGGLATGAPASPDLANRYAGELLDRPLGEFCRRHGIIYTRYLDDLTFSATEPIGKRKRQMIRRIILAAGFQINHKKSIVRDIQKAPVVINGIAMDKTSRIFIPRHYLRKIRGRLYSVKRGRANFAQAAGMMGAFWGATEYCAPHNRTETKLVDRFNGLRALRKLGI